jgi:hypothetical protein
MNLDHFAQMRALETAYIATNRRLVDHLLNGGTPPEHIKLKRIQFDAWEGLSQELDSVCSLLDCSKREFLEVAVYEAIQKAMTAYRQTLDQVSKASDGVQVSLDLVED